MEDRAGPPYPLNHYLPDKPGEKDERYDRHQLYQYVDGRSGGVLEGIAYGISHDCGFMSIRALPAFMALFDVLFGIVPNAT